MSGEHLSFEISGRTVAALAWGAKDDPVLIALHGWLDNAESFYLVAPLIENYRVIAIDLAGHGRSGWHSDPLGYPIQRYVADLRAFIVSMKLSQVSLLGHSLGAGVASLYAGVWPESVKALALIENIGPLAHGDDAYPKALREAIDTSLSSHKEGRIRSLETWVRSRMQSEFPVPRQAAEHLMNRNTLPVSGSGYQLGIDPRLKQVTPRLSEAQIRVTLAAIVAPVLLICSFKSFKQPLTQERLSCVNSIKYLEVEGSHHLHLEPDSALLVARALNEFYA